MCIILTLFELPYVFHEFCSRPLVLIKVLISIFVNLINRVSFEIPYLDPGDSVFPVWVRSKNLGIPGNGLRNLRRSVFLLSGHLEDWCQIFRSKNSKNKKT